MQTQRLILKPAALDDAAFFLALFNSPKWIKYIGDRNVHSIADAEQYLKNRILKQSKTYNYGSYVLILKETGEKIGNVGLYNRPGLDFPDIGFAFLPNYEGQGYGYESASYLLHMAFTEFKLEQVNAITIKENIASQKLIEKLGLTYQKNIKLPNDDAVLLLYTIKADTYLKKHL